MPDVNFDPSEEDVIDDTVAHCPNTTVLIITYIYPEGIPDDQKDATPDLVGADDAEPQESNTAVFKYKFDAEDNARFTILTASPSSSWSPAHTNTYHANTQPNRTTQATISLHACQSDRWIGFSEVFRSQNVYIMQPVGAQGHQHEWATRLDHALQELGAPVATRVETNAGFMRDSFNPIASFRCPEQEEDEHLHPRILVHADNFNRDHVGIQNVLPDLQGQSQGGNVTVTPPTPNCPYGAILIGDDRCWPNSLSSYNQAVLQTIIPVDVSRGSVQHTDEFFGFAGQPNNWKLICASTGLALTLLDRLLVIRPTLPSEQMIPGCLAGQQPDLEVRLNLTRAQGRASFLLDDRRGFFNELAAICEANRTFVIGELGIEKQRAVRVPMLKHLLMPPAANFLPCNGGVVVPQQHSFRITQAEADRVFEGMFADTNLDGLRGHSAHVDFWADHQMTFRDVAISYTADPPSHWQERASPQYQDALERNTAAIALANPNHDRAEQNTFVRIPCPPDTFDLFDAYLFLLYRELDIGLRFVVSAKLHTGGGNVHCATNYQPSLDHIVFDDFPEDVSSVHDLRAKLLNCGPIDPGAVEERRQRLAVAIGEALPDEAGWSSDEDEETSDEGESSSEDD